jgi:hypothetical protein
LVPDLGRVSPGTKQQPASADNPTADAGADRQIDHVIHALTRTKLMFSERS